MPWVARTLGTLAPARCSLVVQDTGRCGPVGGGGSPELSQGHLDASFRVQTGSRGGECLPRARSTPATCTRTTLRSH